MRFMQRSTLLLSFFLIITGLITVAGTTSLFAEEDNTPPYQIENGGFETGDLTGWEVIEGNAFSDAGVTSDTTYWNEDIPFNHVGNYHFHGAYAGGDAGTGIMRSSDFTVGGSGMASFLLGAAPHHNDIYVRFMRVVDEGDDQEVARVVNNKFSDQNVYDYNNRYVRRYVDLSNHMDEVLYIEVHNHYDDGWGIINLDDFITYYEEAPSLEVDTNPLEITVWQYDQEHKLISFLDDRWDNHRHWVNAREFDYFVNIDSISLNYRQHHGHQDLNVGFDSNRLDLSEVDLTTPGTYEAYYTFDYLNEVDGLQVYSEERLALTVTVEAIGTQVANHDFSTGDLTGWTPDGAAFGPCGIIPHGTYWDQNLPFHQAGTYHFYGADCGEENTGTMRSTHFYLEGSGFVSMLLGAGAQSDLTYVRIIDATTDTEIARVTNDKFYDPYFANTYLRHYVDLSEFLDEANPPRLYIEVVNHATGGPFGFINIDDVITYYPEQPVLDVSDDFPRYLEHGSEAPDFSALISHSPNYNPEDITTLDYFDPDFNDGATYDPTDYIDIVIDDSALDMNTPGDYIITYTTSYGGLISTFERTVTVSGRELLDVTLRSYFSAENRPETILEDRPYGTRVAFDDNLADIDGYTFAFWIVNGTVRDELPIDHRFVITENLELEALFAPDGYHAVAFMDTNVSLIEMQHIVSGEDALSPGAEILPDKPGMAHADPLWNKPLENIQSDTVFALQYTLISEAEFTLTVHDNGAVLPTTHAFNAIVTITASETDFSYWMVDGIIVSYAPTYSFTMLEDRVIEAVYGEGTFEGEALITRFGPINLRENRDSYLGQFVLPSGAILIEYGLIASAETGEITLESEKITKFESLKHVAATNEFLMSIPEEYINVRSYLVYELDGTLHYVYSE